MRTKLDCAPNAKRARMIELPSSSARPGQESIATGPENMHLVGTHLVVSVIREMVSLESTVYKPSHYLEGTAVTAHDRKKLCQWGYSLADACKVDRNIATIAITYFDRFLSCRGLRSVEVSLRREREFQLAFVVSIHRTNHSLLRCTFLSDDEIFH